MAPIAGGRRRWTLSALVLVVAAAAVAAAAALPSTGTGREDEGVEYTAAVVPYAPEQHSPSDDLHEVILRHWARCRLKVGEAAARGADIVVVSEGSSGFLWESHPPGHRSRVLAFASRVPAVVNGEPYVNPCEGAMLDADGHVDGPVPRDWGWDQLRLLSCMAVETNVTLVASLVGARNCRPGEACQEDGMLLFNTVVAFSPWGQLLAVYHKHHTAITRPLLDEVFGALEPVYFDTHFGVRFGIMVCKDLAFRDIAHAYSAMGVRDIIYPTAWGNVHPGLLSISITQSFAMLENSNIISANENYDTRIGGSAIVQSDGTFLAHDYHPPHLETNVLIARLRSVPSDKFESSSSSSAHRNLEASRSDSFDNSGRQALEESALLPRSAPASYRCVGWVPWDRDGQCSALSAHSDELKHARVDMGDFACELTYAFEESSALEQWVLSAQSSAKISDTDWDHTHVRSCVVSTCHTYSNCHQFPPPVQANYGSFRYLELHMVGPGVGDGDGEIDVSTGGASDVFFFAVMQGSQQPVNSTAFRVANGGRSLSLDEPLDEPLYIMSVIGFNPTRLDRPPLWSETSRK